MGLSRRAHEWAADRFSFVQYPRLRRQVRSSRVDTALRWGIAAWLLWAIWAPVLAVIGIALVLWLT